MKPGKLPRLALVLLVVLAGCSRDPKSLVATGNKYFDRGKYKEASIMYRRALQKNRKFADAWYRLGLVDAKLQNWNEAMSAYQRAVQLNPGNTDATTKLADLYLASYIFSKAHPKEDLAESKDLVNTLLKRDPNSFDGYRLAGYVALVENKREEATRYLEAANRVRPWQPAVVLMLCEFRTLAGRGPEAEAMARDMIAHDKSYGDIYNFLMQYYFSNKRPADTEAVLQEKIANNPRTGQYVVELARFYQLTGHGDKVAATIQRLTSNTGSYTNAWMLAGDFHLSSGDLDTALQDYGKGETADTKNKVAYQKRRVEALSAKGQTAEANRLADEIVKANPDDPEATALHAVVGIQTARMEQVQKSIDDLGPLIGKYPNVPATPMLRYNLARAYVAKSKLDAGDSDQTKTIKDLDSARIQLEQAFASGDFNHTPARQLLAQVEMERHDYGRAAQTADDILRTQPGNLRARLLRTDALFRMGEMDKADAELNQVLAANPNIEEAQLQLARVDIAEKKDAPAEAILERWQDADPRAFKDLVSLKVAEKKHGEAIQILNRQIAAHPGSGTLLRFALGNVEYFAGNYDQAIAAYRQVLNGAPNMPAQGKAQVYLRIGEAQEHAGDSGAALTSFTAASRLVPNEAKPLVFAGLIYEQSGRTELARASYENALKLDPDDAQAMNNLAYLKANEQVDLDRALSLAQRARQKMPDSIDVEDTLALVYVRKNLTDEALRMTRELVGKQPNNPVYHYHLALALYQKGDKPSAKKELSTALSLKPSPVDQARIRTFMGKIG